MFSYHWSDRGRTVSQAIPKGIAGLNPNHPINLTILALDSSPKIEKTILPLKLLQHPTCFRSPIYKKFQIPFSLSLSLLPISLSQFCPKLLSLSHPPTTLVRWQITPLLWWRTTLTSSESSKLLGTLLFSLYPSLPHSFSHLTSLISSVL